jgi:peptidoglycan/xylan/chitin deacetylase (PgdA/CDA1 family)
MMRIVRVTRRIGAASAIGLMLGLLAACDPATDRSAGPTVTVPTPDPGVTSPSPAASPSAPPATTTTSPTDSTPPPPPPPPPFPSSLAGKDLERIPTSSKVVALTFDAGANADAVSPILTVLEQKGVVATFFLTGEFVADFPQPSRAIAAAGHRMGNHTVSHPHMPTLSDAGVREEVLDAGAAIRDVTGADPAPFFRFPYGDRNAHTIALVNQCGYVAVRWTVDSLGWQGTMGGTRGASFVRDRVLAATAPGAIVLMHVGSHPGDHSTLDADALPGIIDGMRASGYSFVTLDALLT